MRRPSRRGRSKTSAPRWWSRSCGGPGGEQIVRQGDSTLTIDVPTAAAGRWRYSVVAEDVPYANFPFTLTVGAVTTENVAAAKPGAALAPSSATVPAAGGSAALVPGT